MPEIFVPERDSSIVVLDEHPESSGHGSVVTFTGLARIRVNAATPRNCGTNFYRVTLRRARLRYPVSFYYRTIL